MMHCATDPMTPYYAGQVWKQNYSLYFLVMTASKGAYMAIVSAPSRDCGTICCTERDGKWEYTTEELREKFTREGWIYVGRVDEIYSIIPDHPALKQAEQLYDTRGIAEQLERDLQEMTPEEREAFGKIREAAHGRAFRKEMEEMRAAREAKAVAAT